MTLLLFYVSIVVPLLVFLTTTSAAQNIPMTGMSAEQFVPSGWVLEGRITGELNGDGKTDLILRLRQAKPTDGSKYEGQRKLVILLRQNNRQLRRASLAERLLQCATCGGAYYGVVEAAANVKISKGVVIVTQERGSRHVVEQTFRFRFAAQAGKFFLIGVDLAERDRASGELMQSNTNFLTGEKLVKQSRSDREFNKYVVTSTVRSRVPRERITIEQVDHEKY